MNTSIFKKQFQRVRQNIDQNLGRAEKSEVLNEEEQSLERQIELIRTVCQNVSKKVHSCLHTSGQGYDLEKRMKKIPEIGLSHTLIECSVQLDELTPTGQVFRACGDVEGRLAQEVLQMEVDVESKVVKPIQDMLETDIPAIQKLKKQLNTRILDMDGAKARHSSAVKQLQAGAGLQSKVDDAKNEWEDEMGKVEQTKDQLATEMYNFVAKKTDLNKCLLELVEAQANYHRLSLAALEKIIPQVKESIEFSSLKPVFGQLLEEHLENRNREIALVIEECVVVLMDGGLEEEGLFRIAGSASKIKKLKAAFNSNVTGTVIEEIDLHVIASVLKLYLRELPEPLMCCDLYADWMQSLHKPPEQRLSFLQEVIAKMPKSYYLNLRYLIKFLSKLSENSEVNKMSPSNIALVMGPNLLWARGQDGPNMMTTGLQSNIIEMLIANADFFFPGEIEFSGNSRPFYSGTLTQTSIPVTSPNVDITIYKSFDPYSQEVEVNNTSGGSPATLKKASKKLPAPHPPMPPPSSTDPGRSLSNSDVNNVPGRSLADHSSMIDQSPSPRIEKPKIPPPERPQMPPPDKPPANQKPVPAKKNSSLYEDKSSPLNKLPSQSDQNQTAEKPQYRLYPALSETPEVDAASTKTHSRQPSTGSKPPRPQPPVPPKNRDSRFSDSC